MAGFTALLFSVLAICTIGVRAKGEFNIIHSPSSLKWTGHARLLESLLKEVYSASLGLSVEESSKWTGLSIADPFNTPEAIVEVYIDGINSLGNSAHSKAVRYPLTLDEYEPDSYDALSHRIQQRSGNEGNNIVHMTLNNQNEITEFSDIFGSIKFGKMTKKTTAFLKPDSVEEDAQFFQELHIIDEIIEKVSNGAFTPDNLMDFYHFRFMSLHPLSDLHGHDSQETKEAKLLLGQSLERLSAAFVKVYEGSVLVTAVCSDAAHTRRSARSILQTSATTRASEEEWNVAETYSEDYPVIFNIMLWFGIVFAFALLSIVYAIMDMDPGRDSIIYRMTSNRMKKDN